MITETQAERMRYVADLIELNDNFNYAVWCEPEDFNPDGEPELHADHYTALREGSCGTVGCIGGMVTAIQLDEGWITKETAENCPENEAAHWLGLDRRQGRWLFYGYCMVDAGLYNTNAEAMDKATAQEAAKVLRMIADGELPISVPYGN
jgi:hypothetical protein